MLILSVYEFIPNKVESQLTNFIVYDLETHHTEKDLII